MANQIPTTGNTPAPMPNSGQPQTNHLPTIQLDTIRQLDGLYCLNDLHRMAGGREKHRPTEFFRSEQGQSVLSELEREFKGCKIPTPYLQRIIGKGKEQGTYACEEIACSYAMWINPAFHIAVIRAFLKLATITHRVNIQTKKVKDMKAHLSHCGYDLNKHGKETLTMMENDLNQLLDQQQLQLALVEGV